MNRYLFLFLLIIATGLYISNIDQKLSDKFRFVNDIKKYYYERLVSFEQTVGKYFSQVVTIEQLRKENNELRKYESLYIKANTELNRVLALDKNLKISKENLTKTKVLSYAKLDDHTKVWLDLKKEDKKIEGLIAKNYAAGIVISQNNQAMALLNGNTKSNYAVFIGEAKAPGITHSSKNNSELITVKYVPIWLEIKVGDEVITSGMDNIFFEGLKVGKVVSIKKMPNMQEATIKPYADILTNTYYHIYSSEDKELEEKKATNK